MARERFAGSTCNPTKHKKPPLIGLGLYRRDFVTITGHTDGVGSLLGVSWQCRKDIDVDGVFSQLAMLGLVANILRQNRCMALNLLDHFDLSGLPWVPDQVSTTSPCNPRHHLPRSQTTSITSSLKYTQKHSNKIHTAHAADEALNDWTRSWLKTRAH
jgi:hypothetical protein